MDKLHSQSDKEAAANSDAGYDCHNHFLQLEPQIRRQAERYYWHLSAEAREEAVTEVVARAFTGYVSLVESGRANRAFATPLAKYAIRQLNDGRRVGSRSNVRDVMSVACERRNGVVERLSGFENGGGWQDLLADNRHWTPAEQAAFRIDFGSWLATLSPRDRRIAEELAEGASTAYVSALFKLSKGRISQLRRELHRRWNMFVGELANTYRTMPCSA